jgi:hypothetical protein
VASICEVWDAAIANQALIFLSHTELAHCSSVYSNLRDISTLFNGGMMSLQKKLPAVKAPTKPAS